MYLSYSRLFGALERDGVTLLDYVTRIVRGRGGNVDRYNLSMFQQIAVAANRYAKRVPPENDQPRPPPVRKTPPKAVTPKKKSGAKAIDVPEPVDEPQDDEDDFLDVRDQVRPTTTLESKCQKKSRRATRV